MSGALLLSPCCRQPLYRCVAPLFHGQRMASGLVRHLDGRVVEVGEVALRCPQCGVRPKLARLIQQEPNG